MTWPIWGWFEDVGRYFRLVKNKHFSQVADYTTPHYATLTGEVRARLQRNRLTLKLIERIAETPSTATLRFESQDGPIPHFEAGQYVNLFIEFDDVRTSRPYSISSAPGLGYLDLSVRRKPGGLVSAHLLDRVKIGDVLQSTKPSGHFIHQSLSDGSDLVFLAGGSGITPFMSMLRSQAQKAWPLKIQLVYGCRSPDDVLFGDELADLARDNDHFGCTLVFSEAPEGFAGVRGLLDAPRIRESLGEWTGQTFFVCGPKLMIELCSGELDKLGVPRFKIRKEEYGPPDDITKEPGWPEHVAADATFRVEIEGRETIWASACEPLLTSLERNGLVVPTVCRTGSCSACRTKVLSGRVFMPPGNAVREADLKHGYIHPCLSYPLENLKIKLP